jgi:predicted DNA-binding WGR domain protein
MARFYVLAIEPTLFGDTAVVREWGRIGSLGRRRLDLYPDTASAAEALLKGAAWLSSPSVKLVVLIGADGTRTQ